MSIELADYRQPRGGLDKGDQWGGEHFGGLVLVTPESFHDTGSKELVTQVT